MVKHYDPYFYNGTSGAEGSGEPYTVEYEHYVCGTAVNPNNDIEITNVWSQVTCKKCLKQRPEIDKSVARAETAICNSLGDMAEYISKKERECNHD
jgi:hypothetical protein